MGGAHLGPRPKPYTVLRLVPVASTYTATGTPPAAKALPALLAEFREAGERLPFRAEGVFISARRVGEDRYQVILMDTEMFAPADTEAEVVTTTRGLTCRDEITGEMLPVTDGCVSVTVAAGAFRVLAFEPTG